MSGECFPPVYEPISLESTLTAAVAHEPRFLQLTREAVRASKGVRPSEMFFVCAGIAGANPSQILESGTASGQSTYFLARFFPQARVVTWEIDPEDPLAAIARERLGPVENVELRYGDSRGPLAASMGHGDAVVIDGPKGYRALGMAMELLATGNPIAVYLHDFSPGLPERRFVERHLPEAFFSDDERWNHGYGYLDGKRLDAPRRGKSPAPRAVGGVSGAGGVFVCLPRVSHRTGSQYRRLGILRSIYRALDRLRPRRG